MAKTTWCNEEFVSAFFTNGLGRKRQYGNYYVAEVGDDFRFLMKKSLTGPSTLQAIDFQRKVYIASTYGDVLNDLEEHNKFNLSKFALDRSVDYSDCKCLDEQDGSYLFWFGGNEFLVCREEEERKTLLPVKDWLSNKEGKVLSTIHLAGNYGTVEKAKKSFVHNEEEGYILEGRLLITNKTEEIPTLDMDELRKVFEWPFPGDFGIPLFWWQRILESSYSVPKNLPGYSQYLEKVEAKAKRRREIFELYPSIDSLFNHRSAVSLLASKGIEPKLYRKTKEEILVQGLLAGPEVSLMLEKPTVVYLLKRVL